MKNGRKTLAAAKLLSLLLVLALLWPLLAAPKARARESGQWSYEEQGDGSVIITGYEGSAEELSVPAELDGKPVTAIGDGVFAENPDLVRVTVPEGVLDENGRMEAWGNDLVIRYLDRVVVKDDGYEVAFKTGVTVEVEV